MSQEVKRCPSYWWITLTYNDANLPTIEVDGVLHSVVIKSEVQNFLKRLRQRLGFPELRYFAVGEYGGKLNRAHYHLIIFTNVWKNVYEAYLDVFAAWSPDGDNKGFVYCKRGQLSKINYVTKYANKLDRRHHFAKPFKLMSKGLGLSFLSPAVTNYYLYLKDRKVYDGSREIPLPRYYVRKLDEVFDNIYHAGLKWSETCKVHNIWLPSSELINPRDYHSYFVENFEDISDSFIDYELESPYITKFLDPTPNMVFDWFLETNEVTRNDIWQGKERLEQLSLHEHFEDYSQPIGADVYQFGDVNI